MSRSTTNLRIALYAVLFGAVIAFIAGTQCAGERTGALIERAEAAEQVAVRATLEGSALRLRARAEMRRADLAQARADSVTRVAILAGETLRGLVARFTTTRAAVDHATIAGLPPLVQRLIEEGDSLRLAVTPMMASYESAIAAHVSTEARLYLVIARQDSALRADSIALAAREVQVRTLEQLRAPRCGWRCGAVIGAVGALVVPRAGKIIAAVNLLRKP